MERDLRAALQYVPLFSGKVFVLVLDTTRLTERMLAEILLDLRSLQQVGVRMVLVLVGGDREDLCDRLVDEEIRWQLVDPKAEKATWEAVLERGQLALTTWPEAHPLGDEVARLAVRLEAVKLLTLWSAEELGSAFGEHAISSRAAAEWTGLGEKLLRRAAEVCVSGVPRVHLLDEKHQGVVLEELFSNEGVGIMVHTDAYLEVRKLRREDVSELLAMIGRSIRAAHLVPRTFEEIEGSLDDFQVLTIDENVVGCVALHRYSEPDCAEIACLYVKQSHEKGGYGQILVEAAEADALAKGIPWVFALTTRAFYFFTEKLGYEEVSPGDIPDSRRKKLLESARGSKVIRKVMGVR